MSVSNPDGAPPSTSDLVDVLQRAVGQVRAHFATATAAVGVTPVQAKLLRNLAEPLTVKELSARLAADVSNTASGVDRLESLGLASKETDPNDRRARVVALTERGRQVREALEENAFRAVPALERLSDAERHQLHALLAKVVGER